MENKIGVLLTNIGTPAAPTTTAVRSYLRKFLSDKRVVELPRLIWWPILYGIILPLRSKRSAKLYQKIWTQEGSPLLLNTQKITKKLKAQLNCPVELGMQYSDPSIHSALEALRKKKVRKIIVLPLYPQYSATTTASTLDQVANTFKTWRNIPEVCTINNYSSDHGYIQALCDTILKTWQLQGKKHLLFSFHGIPKRYITAGDPYLEHCKCTVLSITKKLELTDAEWSLAFQSRLGRAEWLTPYTNEVLNSLPKKGITDLHMICPGFAADCLETLEEIVIRGQETFLQAGGKSFYYIPALNDSDEHINVLDNIIKKSLHV
jgi:ferrochelatase